MSEVINLRMARKRAKREQEALRSTANRVDHGRSKSERTLAAARRDKASRDLNEHQIETGDDR